MRDGYILNLTKCSNVEKGKIQGMKSHDCYVFMETLLSFAFGTLPMHDLDSLIETYACFKSSC